MATTCQGKKLTSCSAGPPQGSGVQREPPHTPVLTCTSVPQLQPEAATAPGQSQAQPADIALESPVTHYVIPEDFYRVEDESDLNLDLVTATLTSHTHTQRNHTAATTTVLQPEVTWVFSGPQISSQQAPWSACEDAPRETYTPLALNAATAVPSITAVHTSAATAVSPAAVTAAPITTAVQRNLIEQSLITNTETLAVPGCFPAPLHTTKQTFIPGRPDPEISAIVNGLDYLLQTTGSTTSSITQSWPPSTVSTPRSDAALEIASRVPLPTGSDEDMSDDPETRTGQPFGQSDTSEDEVSPSPVQQKKNESQPHQSAPLSAQSPQLKWN